VPSLFMLILVLSFSLLIITFKASYFIILVLFEIRLMLAAYSLLVYCLPAWFILPLLGIGASEGATGLSLSVWLSRSMSVTQFTL